MLSANLGPNQSGILQVVEDPTELIIPGLLWHEVIKPGDMVQGWDGAAEVARDAVPRVADQESKMKLFEQLSRHNSRVVRLGGSAIRERCSGLVEPIGTIDAVQAYGGVTQGGRALDSVCRRTAAVGLRAIGADATFDLVKRWSEAS